jgi:YVTN family beta-propeller protein
MVSVIDTAANRVVENIVTTAPAWLLKNPRQYTGSGPNSLALSPDEKTLYVTNGGSNAVAVVQLGHPSWVTALLPTGWYPNGVAVSADNRFLYVVNGKTAAGPNPDRGLRKAQNEYILQLEKAGLLTLPLPDKATMQKLTRAVAANNNLVGKANPDDVRVMGELHQRIKHVIYIIKENRTYDQVLGDLGKGNGDAALAESGRQLRLTSMRLRVTSLIWITFITLAMDGPGAHPGVNRTSVRRRLCLITRAVGPIMSMKARIVILTSAWLR